MKIPHWNPQESTVNKVLIIHGWSDGPESFKNLSNYLLGKGHQVIDLYLGDYISMQDDVHVSDVGRRMGEVINGMIDDRSLSTPFDMIVHSTGGLVVREWITTFYGNHPQSCPLKHLVMLAPANYGSKLAASGKSLLGRVFKGYDHWFHTGTAMLNDLELSSPYQWALAKRDVLIAPGDGNTTQYYGEDGIWPFVIVGTHPYASLLRQVVNENGADGTVRVCAANLQAKGMTLVFDASDSSLPPQQISWKPRIPFPVALAVLPTRTHSSIYDPDRIDPESRDGIPETPAEMAQLGDCIIEALQCKDFIAYKSIQQSWATLTNATSHHPAAGHDKDDIYHQYLQANVSVIDDSGNPVTDYFIEFFTGTTEQDTPANVYLHSKVIEDVKENSIEPSLRNLYVDFTDLTSTDFQEAAQGAPYVYLSISASPPGPNVSYFDSSAGTANSSSSGQVRIHAVDSGWIQPNTTHFVEVVIPRRPAAGVFKLLPFDPAMKYSSGR